MVSVGDRFGKLTTKEQTILRTTTRNVKAWECLCDCGNTTVVSESNLTRKVPTRSCGCGRVGKSRTTFAVADKKCSEMGYKLTDYSGKTHSRSTVVCKSCGEVCETRLDNLWSGYIPCKCSRSRRLTEKDILEKLLDFENVVSITVGNFERGNTECSVVFSCGHSFTRRFSKFYSTKCPNCCGTYCLTEDEIVERVKSGFTVCLGGGGAKEVLIKCHEHGEIYKDTIYNHIKTSGCRMCIGRRKSEAYSSPIEEMIECMRDTKFIPDASSYKNMTSKMRMMCPDGHTFYAEPVRVIRGGRGCPFCARYGFKRNERGKFYVTRFRDEKGSYLKYGITNRTANARAVSQRRKGNKDYEIVMEKEFDGETCLEIERIVRETLGGSFCTKDRKPDGYTETLEDNEFNLTTIERIVEKYAKEI